MSLTNKLKSKILNKSDMYNFYKKEYENTGKKIREHEKILKNMKKCLKEN